MASGRLAGVLAWVLPVGILAAVAWWLAQPEPDATIVSTFEERLALGHPEVVVLGSSLAKTDLDEALLADRLGLARRQVVLLTLPRATAPHIYAILRNRVFAEGHRPSVVLWVGALTAMATPDVLGDEAAVRLVRQLEGDEDVLARKTFGVGHGLVLPALQARARAERWRSDQVSDVRDRLLGLVWTGSPDPEAGREQGRQARATVLREAALDRKQAQGPRAVWGLGGQEMLDLTGLDVARDSLLPDIVALTKAHDARLVLVRVPFPPTHADNDRVPGEVERDAMAVVREGGGAFLDLRGLPLGDADFRDMRHLTERGARVLTNAVADGILAASRGEDVGQQGRLSVAEVQGGSVSGLDAVRAALAARGLQDAAPVPDPDGDGILTVVSRPRHPVPAVWIAPGGRLALDGVQAPMEVVAHVRVFGDGHGAQRVVVLSPQAPVVDGDPEFWTWVEALATTDGRVVFGDPAATQGAAARIVGGVRVDTAWEAVFATEPPEVSVAEGFVDGPGGLVGLRAPGFAPLADDGWLQHAQPHRCSPLRVLEDGVALPRPDRPCGEVVRKGRGRTCHEGEDVYFQPVDGTDPRTNGRAYTLALDPGRECDRRWVPGTSPERDLLWVYPGDEVVLPLTEEARGRLVDGVDRLAFTLDPVTALPGETIRIALEVGGDPVWETVVTAQTLDRIDGVGHLVHPLPPRPERVALRLTHDAPGGGFWRLVRLTLAGSREGEAVAPQDVAARWPVGLVREGRPAEVRLTPGGEVGAWRLHGPVLEGLDDAALGGPWSPVVVRAGGRVLARVLDEAALSRCGDCFWHGPDGLHIRASHRPAVSWASAVPWRTPDGAQTVWLLPGTSLRTEETAPGPWRPVLRGPSSPEVEVGPEGALSLPATASPVLVERLELVRDGASWAVVSPPSPRIGRDVRRPAR